ncbi:MAG: hypothetical protein K2I79_00540, partial [Clostridia bacterium]|nr:hypothetical protein [Clostridia bacterium]
MYQGNGIFNRSALDSVAVKAGYSDIEDLIKKVSQDPNANTMGVKDASDFGNVEIKFGSYEFNGTTYELNWIPCYLSKNKDGNPILTLWLASTDSSNGTVSNQEVSSFSNGTYDATQATKDWNGKNIYSNAYDGSYIRNYVLNGNENYLSWRYGSAIQPPELETMTKFAKFTTGELSEFITAPSEVEWQISMSVYKNEPSCSALDSYPNDWTNDKIWLPGQQEIYRTYNANDSLFNLTNAQKSNCVATRLRTLENTTNSYVVSNLTDTGSYTTESVAKSMAVRPALNLNLVTALSGSVNALAAPTDFNVTYDGKSKDISSAEWYDKDIHGDTSKMTVTYSQDLPTNFGEYTVTLTIEDSQLTWKDASSPTDKTRTCKMTIEKASPNITPVIGMYTLYTGDGLDKFPSISLPDNAPSGTISWDSGQTATTTKAYNWTFKSTDNNYTDKKGSTTLTVTALDITSIEASFTPSGTIYTSTSLDSLKSGLTVTKKYN